MTEKEATLCKNQTMNRSDMQTQRNSRHSLPLEKITNASSLGPNASRNSSAQSQLNFTGIDRNRIRIQSSKCDLWEKILEEKADEIELLVAILKSTCKSPSHITSTRPPRHFMEGWHTPWYSLRCCLNSFFICPPNLDSIIQPDVLSKKKNKTL